MPFNARKLIRCLWFSASICIVRRFILLEIRPVLPGLYGGNRHGGCSRASAGTTCLQYASNHDTLGCGSEIIQTTDRTSVALATLHILGGFVSPSPSHGRYTAYFFFHYSRCILSCLPLNPVSSRYRRRQVRIAGTLCFG